MRGELRRLTDLGSVFRFLKVLLFMSFACCLLAGIRVHLTGDYSYLFLIWNLFLAWVPLIIVYALKKIYYKVEKKYLLLFGTSAVWLLFFPNSPYIITDLIHINPEGASRVWFDAILIFSFALTGLIAGFISLYILHEMLDSLFNRFLNWSLIIFIFLLSGYGIFLGRVLRWNSWDLFTRPKPLLLDVTTQIMDPEALFMTLVFTFFMIFSYLILHSLIHLKHQDKENDPGQKMSE